MLPEEAGWVGHVLSQLPSESFPLLNIGSQTEEYRRAVQPWVDDQIFLPLQENVRQVCHVDVREAAGVDLVANITTDQGFGAVRDIGARSVLCSNLLEHVLDPEAFLKKIVSLVPEGGHLVVTGPTHYPYHPDPIDNLFRPTARELAARLEPDLTILANTQIEIGTYGRYLANRHGKLRLAARLAAPFHRPGRWRELIRWVNKPISSYCVHATRRSPS